MFGWDVGKLGREGKRFLIHRVGEGLKMSEVVSVVYFFSAVEVFLLFVGVLDLREDIAAFFVLLH